ncbi:MAG: GHKL domain-containing protein [Bacteroidales bacterium]|nr:GHKL domain-containing protein [Bacteroidales bacterium]MBN2762947.1 GHKL domain-containing protein [Bacteroidales bacterium]
MIYRSFNLSVIIRLIIFAFVTALLGLVLYQRNWLMAGPLMVAVLVSFFELVYFLNGVNRKVAFFFDAVTNDDTTLHYAENIRTKSLRALHQSFNRLNQHIADMKIKNAHNEKFFHEMLKSSATGLLAVDEKGYIEQINDSALDFIGLPHITHIDLLKQKNHELYEQLMHIMPGQSRTIKVLHGTELSLFSLKVALLNFGENRYRLYSVSDIRAEIEENELDSWQKLIRVMTHEIMNSIAPITSLCNTLSRIFIRNKNPLPVQEVTDKHIDNIINGLEVIENTGRGLMRFVEDYRRLTKVPDPVFKPIIINDWLNAIRLLMKNRLDEENIRFSIVNKGYHEKLLGDEKLLSQVMINIINNAVDALKNTEHKKIVIRVAENASGRLKISISNNGKAIPPEETDKIFVPFYTTKDNGSGIGLSLSRKIMRSHKGSLSVFSQAGKPTTFFLSF